MTTRTTLTLLGLCSMLASAGAVSAATITGTASWRERVALSRDAVFEVRLLDVSRADGPAEVVSRWRTTTPGQSPIRFELTYDAGRIDDTRTYVVRATIHENGVLRFTTDRTYPVITRGAGRRVELLMVRGAGTGEPARPPEAALGRLPATFRGTLPCADCAGIRTRIDFQPGGGYVQRSTYLLDGHDDTFYEVGRWQVSSDARTVTLSGGRTGPAYWAIERTTLRRLDVSGRRIESELPYTLVRGERLEPIEYRGALTGMFRYEADAAHFRDCASGIEWPVSNDDDYLALERAYGERRASPGAELRVTLHGRIELRPRIEGTGQIPMLVVERFDRVAGGEGCEPVFGEVELGNTRWRAVRIGEAWIGAEVGPQEPWIQFDPRTMQVSGSGGCNRIRGGYTLRDGALRLGRLAATRMACPALEVETAFLRALEAARRYRTFGRHLELIDASGDVVALLEERNL